MSIIKRYSFESEQQATELIALLEVTGTIVKLGFQHIYGVDENGESVIVEEATTYDVDVLWQNEAPISWIEFESDRIPTHLFGGEVLKTQEEIEVEKQANKKATRNQLLKNGIIVQDIWFNEDKLTQFTVMAQMCAANNVPSFEWGKESGWGIVTVNEAFQITMEASQKFSQIYKDFA